MWMHRSLILGVLRLAVGSVGQLRAWYWHQWDSKGSAPVLWSRKHFCRVRGSSLGIGASPDTGAAVLASSGPKRIRNGSSLRMLCWFGGQTMPGDGAAGWKAVHLSSPLADQPRS